MALLSTRITGTVFDVVTTMYALDQQYFGPINSAIASHRNQVIACVNTYAGQVSEWYAPWIAETQLWSYVIAAVADEYVVPVALTVSDRLRRFDWFGLTLSTIDNVMQWTETAIAVAQVVWVITSFLCTVAANHIADPVDGSNFAAQMRLHHQQMEQFQALSNDVDEAIAASVARVRGISLNDLLLEQQWEETIAQFNTSNEEPTAAEPFNLQAVFHYAYLLTFGGERLAIA